jgi:glycosyltransferase involved in cell wall biosynthesis
VYYVLYPDHRITFGGAEKQIYYLGRELAKEPTITVNLCVPDHKQDECTTAGNLFLWKSFAPDDNKFDALRKLVQTLSAISADFYIFRSASINVFIGFWITKYLLKRKTVYMIASDNECTFSRLCLHRGIFTSILMNWLYNKADVIFAQSQLQLEAFATLRKEKCTYTLQTLQPITLNAQIIDFDRKETILWVGRCESCKRPELFIDLATRFPTEKFVMIMPPATGKKQYFDLVKSISTLVSNLQVHDFVPPETIKTFYKQAKLFVITSASEGMPQTIFEACEAMCPIVSLSVNPDDKIDGYGMGLCANGDLNLFFKYVETLINDKEMRTTFGKNARQNLEKFHDPQLISRKFLTSLAE